MSEKPRMRDGVIRRGSTWAYAIRVTDASGRSKPKWVGGFSSEAAAKAARDEARVAARRGQFVHRNDLTVEQYLKTWLDGHALEVRPKTLEDYRSLIERYVVPRLGKMRLQSVRPATVSAFYGTLRREGGKDGGPLSPRTVNYVHSVLRKAFNDAVHIDQLLAVNPTLLAKRPRVDAVQPVHAMWGRDELHQFLAAVAAHRLYPFFRLAAFTGARRGELFYLHWSSVVLDGPDPHVWIEGSTAIVRGRRVDGMTKTGRARRVSIDEGTVQALRDHAEQQAKEREVVGEGWPDTDRVFRMEMGGPLRVDLPGEVMRSTIAAINRQARNDPAARTLTPIRLHDLRHVHATLLLKAGVPVHVVAARLGHRDAAMTLRVYAHVLSDQASSAAAMFAHFMGEEGQR
jgi:integrase